MIGRLLSGRYELLEEIGYGGMAVIYSAKDLKLNRTVAVKVLREGFSQNTEFLQRFRREGYAMMHIQHPNIVQVYDVGYDDDVQYIVMELVPGETLKQYIQRTGGLRCTRIRAHRHSPVRGVANGTRARHHTPGCQTSQRVDVA